ncbi:MAG: histidine kinase [Cyclobacteriaceae bacterium]
MTHFFPRVFSRENRIHLLLWIGFSFLVNIYAFKDFGVQQGLLNVLGTFLFFSWLIFSHLYWALPSLLSKPRKYVTYLVKFLVVLIVSISLSAFSTKYLREVDDEFKSALYDETWRYFLWVTIESVVLIFISSAVKFSIDFFKLQAHQTEIEKQKLEVELKYLKLQINPHFLFNTLNNLLLLTNKQSPKASAVVEKLAYMMRYLLEKDKNDTVPLRVEIEFLKSYIDLEKIRIKDVDVSFDIEGDVQGQQLPPALLMTLIENAFKHGVKKSDASNYVHIELQALPKEVHLKVVNPYHSKTSVKDIEGIGLENLRKRLNLIYGENYELAVGKTDEGTFQANLKCATL